MNENEEKNPVVAKVTYHAALRNLLGGCHDLADAMYGLGELERLGVPRDAETEGAILDACRAALGEAIAKRPDMARMFAGLAPALPLACPGTPECAPGVCVPGAGEVG